MSIVKLTLPLGEIPVNGKQVTFVAPCDCSVTEYLQIDGVNYTIVDSRCECVTGKGGRWVAGATLSVALDVDNKRAYILNQPDEHSADDITSGVLPVERGGTGTTSLASLFTALGGCKIKHGTYTGTGAVGVAGTITLTFPFTPKFVAVMFQGEGSPFEKARAFFVYGSDTFTEMYNPEAGTRGHLRCTWGENSLSWYLAKTCSNAFDEYEITDESDSLNDRYALNCTNREYHYIAIG